MPRQSFQMLWQILPDAKAILPDVMTTSRWRDGACKHHIILVCMRHVTVVYHSCRLVSPRLCHYVTSSWLLYSPCHATLALWLLCYVLVPVITCSVVLLYVYIILSPLHDMSVMSSCPVLSIHIMMPSWHCVLKFLLYLSAFSSRWQVAAVHHCCNFVSFL